MAGPPDDRIIKIRYAGLKTRVASVAECVKLTGQDASCPPSLVNAAHAQLKGSNAVLLYVNSNLFTSI